MVEVSKNGQIKKWTSFLELTTRNTPTDKFSEKSEL